MNDEDVRAVSHQPPDPLAVGIEHAFREARKIGASITEASQAVAEFIHQGMDEEALAGLSDDGIVHMQSTLGHRTGEPMVQCWVGAEKWQWTPQTAREHAMALLECAEAAVHDAGMYRWLTLGNLGLPAEAAVMAVGELRRFRGDVPREDWVTKDPPRTG